MIKMDRELKDIPVYLLTAIPRSEVEKNIKESMADGLILKPFDFADFEMILNYLSEKKKLSKEAERNNQQDEWKGILSNIISFSWLFLINNHFILVLI